MAGSVSQAVNHWVEWSFRTLFCLLMAVIGWQMTRIFDRVDDQDDRIRRIEIEFAEQRTKVDTQIIGMRETLLDIKEGQSSIGRMLDEIRNSRD